MKPLSADDKVRFLRELTRGAEDVYATRADDAWRPVYGDLPDEMLKMHMSGAVEIGSYPLLATDSTDALPTLWWIGADFDGKKPGTLWQTDVKQATAFLLDTGATIFVNLSRSALGAHIRVLFREPVPAWMARRWMMAWLEEAGVVRAPDTGQIAPSFDRLIPPQDTLSDQLTQTGHRSPGNLLGNPLHGGIAKTTGGTLPIDPKQAALGNFTPDGKHWEHVVNALEHREWGGHALLSALAEAPGVTDTSSPEASRYRHLPVMSGDDRDLSFVLRACMFMRRMQTSDQPYPLWIALASQLHRFGEAGHTAWHEISALDPRYKSRVAERKWHQTTTLHPVGCKALVANGYRCPHLVDVRCAGSAAPSYLAEHARVEVL